MLGPNSKKRREWRRKAAQKNAIVPKYFVVTAANVLIICGMCRTKFHRNLIPDVDEPTFVCPNKHCGAKNWVPVRFKFRRFWYPT